MRSAEAPLAAAIDDVTDDAPLAQEDTAPGSREAADDATNAAAERWFDLVPGITDAQKRKALDPTKEAKDTLCGRLQDTPAVQSEQRDKLVELWELLGCQENNDAVLKLKVAGLWSSVARTCLASRFSASQLVELANLLFGAATVGREPSTPRQRLSCFTHCSSFVSVLDPKLKRQSESFEEAKERVSRSATAAATLFAPGQAAMHTSHRMSLLARPGFCARLHEPGSEGRATKIVARAKALLRAAGYEDADTDRTASSMSEGLFITLGYEDGLPADFVAVAQQLWRKTSWAKREKMSCFKKGKFRIEFERLLEKRLAARPPADAAGGPPE